MGRGFIELYDDDGFRYFVNIDKIVNVSVDNKRVWTWNAVEHFLIFQHDQEFFAVDDEIMVGPCSSRDESAHEFGRWKLSREINRYNAMKEFLDDARRRD